MAKTNAQKQRAMRQEELRELLSKKGLVEQVIKDIEKIDELASLQIDDFEDADLYLASVSSAKDRVSMIKVSIDSRMKLVSKYLPDLKATEVSGPGGSAIEIDSLHTLSDELLERIIAGEG